ncbi:unnamed protein product, partial [Coregonus sp. 'balchen']
FGCQVCRWTAAEISKLEPDLTANGIALVGIGPEETGLKEFKEGGFFKGDLYIDEKKQCYKDLGFKRYTALSVVPAALGKKIREVTTKAKAQGIQGNFTGDLLQSGGMLIVAKGGEKVLLHFVQDSPGDYVPLEDISKALDISANVQAGERPQPEPCGEVPCEVAGEVAWEAAGEVAWEAAGEVAWKAAGEVAWEAAGEVAWEAAGEVAWEAAGEVAWIAVGTVNLYSVT